MSKEYTRIEMKKIMNQVYKNADAYSKTENLMQSIEECSELQKAITKYMRARGVGQPTDVSEEESYNNLLEEIADVYICSQQILYMLKISNNDIWAEIERKANIASNVISKGKKEKDDKREDNTTKEQEHSCNRPVNIINRIRNTFRRQ